ncbi:pyridoxamine 5'-phosphate oxidase family protein [Roseibium sp.]|uniref:pyridoxamine 5'-phosphate oxidase family protein n=1 Tax=Roseibium sp. TaxID=1936156 RepID=UPI003BADAD96
MQQDLTTIDREAWDALDAAAADARQPFRYLTLASLGRCQFPEARTVVLRSVEISTRVLEFHTDTRSPKWQELQDNGNTTILGYSDALRLQLRLRGQMELAPPGSHAAEQVWSRLPLHTRATYQGGPPGDELPSVDGPVYRDQDVPSEETGKERFGVLFFRAVSLDWCRLARDNNLRARFSYGESGTLKSASWIAP